jgi:predicted TIM-barrel fold metal-dependent hydrolase
MAVDLSDVEIPPIISVDDHVIEPPLVWQDRLPKKWLDVGPRVERLPIGEMELVGGRYVAGAAESDSKLADWWHYEDLMVPHRRIHVAAGLPREDMDLAGVTYDEMRPGCYEVGARLLDMDKGHIDASLCFPTFPRFCGQTFAEAKDKELALLCVRAYNDWMVDEWSGESGGRLIPLCLVPLWDANLAADEVRRNAARGVTAVAFSEVPAFLGLPSIHDKDHYWSPFFEACAETSTVVCMHIGSSSTFQTTSDDAPRVVTAALTFNNAMLSLTDFLLSGVLVRHPTLKIAYSEGQIGWIPYILERIDTVWEEHRAWTRVQDSIPEPPSAYYYRQVFGCFFNDQHGVNSLDEVGRYNVTFESDYPHVDSNWPYTKEVAQRLMKGLPPDVIYDLIRGNARRMLGMGEEPA